MPVLRDTAGSESMSSRHMCSSKVSAIAAWSCWVWMMEEPVSLDFDMFGAVSAGTVLEGGEDKGVKLGMSAPNGKQNPGQFYF